MVGWIPYVLIAKVREARLIYVEAKSLESPSSCKTEYLTLNIVLRHCRHKTVAFLHILRTRNQSTV